MCQPHAVVVRRNRGLAAAGLRALGIAPLGCSSGDPPVDPTSAGTATTTASGQGGSGGAPSTTKASIQRLVSFVSGGNPVTWVLGTHIEMNTSGDDHAMGSDHHPDEHPLQLAPAVLTELHEATQAMGNSPQYQAHQDFIIYPL